MRIRNTGLTLFAGLSIFVAACSSGTASTAPSKAPSTAPTTAPSTAPASQAPSTAPGSQAPSGVKIGLVTDVGTLEDKSFNEASWIGAQAGAKTLGGIASNIVTKNAADYAANIKTFVDQGYGIIVTTGFAAGDATTIAAKQYPNVKFIGVDQGVCIDETGKGDPTFACKGDPKTLLPNYQGLVFKEEQVGYLAGVLAAGVSKTGVIGTVGGINTIPPVVRYINGYRNGAASVNDKIDVKVAYVSTDIQKAFNDPGTGKSIAKQMVQLKADVIFQVAGLSGAGAIEHAPAWHHRHRRRRRPVEVAAAVGQVHPEQRREESLTQWLPRSGRSAPRPMSAARPSGTPRPLPPGVGLSPFGSDYKDLVTPELQAKIDAALAGMEGRHRRPLQADSCTKKD
jgi:basic membrane lipoprotein Med (substrate-binding protein (PBP1-ABC) superfamily)